MRRGDICDADLSPTVGSGANKPRPVPVVSNDADNRAASTVAVLPISANVTRLCPLQVRLPRQVSGLPKDSEAQAQQMLTLAGERISAAALGRLREVGLRLAPD